ELSFFLPSSGRHASFARDWSSDVCSSDLVPFGTGAEPAARASRARGPARAVSNDAERGRPRTRGQEPGIRSALREALEVRIAPRSEERRVGGGGTASRKPTTDRTRGRRTR